MDPRWRETYRPRATLAIAFLPREGAHTLVTLFDIGRFATPAATNAITTSGSGRGVRWVRAVLAMFAVNRTNVELRTYMHQWSCPRCKYSADAYRGFKQDVDVIQAQERDEGVQTKANVDLQGQEGDTDTDVEAKEYPENVRGQFQANVDGGELKSVSVEVSTGILR